MNFWRRSRQSLLLKPVVMLAAGAAVAQAIPLAVSPALTRLYAPTDWGVFSLFMTMTATLGSVASGRYELAIMLPDTDEDARALAVLGILISGAVALTLLAVVLAFADPLALLLGEPALAPWLILAAPTVLFMGLFNCLNYLTTRGAAYSAVAVANVSKATVGAAAQVALGFTLPGPGGLITGYTVSSVAAITWLVKRQLSRARGLASRRHLSAVARSFADFPKYSVGSALAQTANLALISVLIARLYSVHSLGEFALVQRVLGLPLVVVAASVGQVYFQRASAEKRDRGDFLDSFNGTLRGLTAVALVSTLILYITLPTAFSTVFGSQWVGAGNMARAVLPGFLVQFIVSPLSLSNQINLRNRFGLVGNLVAFVAMCMAFALSASMGATVRQSLFVMSLAQACYYAGFLYLISRHVAAARAIVRPK